MRLRNVKNAKEIVESSKYVINNPEEYKSKFKSIFKNDNNIHLEIGTGKGNFLIGMAKKYPNINFIGIEKYESVLVRAIEKIEIENLENIRFIRYDATYINNLFNKEIDTLYLNFSDPWPKARHAKRRLTSPYFLNLYDNIFSSSCKIIQKTDNINLFAYSLETLSNHGYVFERVSLDLHSEDIENIETEYETRFASQGTKINYLVAKK